MKTLFYCLIFFYSISSLAQKKTNTENVILITLDGMRWQEVFGGADQRLVANKKLVRDTVSLKGQYWAKTAQERRMKLMPFFWSTVATQGQLYGNRPLGNKVNTRNKMWFSYPGYNEILTGFADDTHITSNDAVNNPNKNVLEFVQAQKGFAGKVAAFTSWETFPWIINTQRNGVPVNAGWTKTTTNPTAEEKLMNDLMFQLPNTTGGTRLDGFTFQYAMEYLKKRKPRVMFISFDETDHFAHEGMYDLYLSSAHYTDGFIQSLWSWLQTQPQYKNKTSLIITTDHGRGGTDDEDWKHHGSKVADADQIWMAILGPDTAPLGEIATNQQLYQGQVAKSLAALLGLEYSNDQGVVSEVIPGAVK